MPAREATKQQYENWSSFLTAEINKIELYNIIQLQKNLLEQSREPTNDVMPSLGHIAGRRVFSPLRHPCSRNSGSRVDTVMLHVKE